MAGFEDSRGNAWVLDIKEKDVTMVKNLVKDSDGKPIDLLAMADTGNLYQLYGRAASMLEIVFLCCLDQVKELFDESAFDASHEIEFQAVPGLKSSRLKKMSMWWGEGIGSSQISPMMEAFKEALVNFTPNPYQREALRRVFENQEALERARLERILPRIDADREREVENLDAELQKRFSPGQNP